jgi:hypothetical protein
VGAFTSHASAALFIASRASLLFWILETFWKSFQLGYYSRIEAIEAYYRSPGDAISSNHINHAWMKHWRNLSWLEVYRMAWWPHIALPHVFAVVVGVFLFVLAQLGLVRV